MAENQEAADQKAAQLQGKLQTIKDYTEWLLTLKEAWFSQHALYDAVLTGGWKVDIGNEKRTMRNYLSSIAENHAEPEERREKAKMLRHKIDVETNQNAQKRIWTRILTRRSGKLQIGMLGGQRNSMYRSVGRGGRNSGRSRMRGAVAGQRGRPGPAHAATGGQGQAHAASGAFSTGGWDTAGAWSSGEWNNNADNAPAQHIIGEQGESSWKQSSGAGPEGGPFVFRAGSGYPSKTPVFNPGPDFGNPCPPASSQIRARSSSKHANSEPPRKILGALPPNFQPAPPRTAAFPKQGAGVPTTSTSRPDRAPGDCAREMACASSDCTDYHHAAFGGAHQRGRGSGRDGAPRGMWSAQQQRYVSEWGPPVAPQQYGTGYGGAQWAPGAAGPSYGAPLGMTSHSSWRPAEMTSYEPHARWDAWSEGHLETDFLGRHVDVSSGCHGYRATERPKGASWSGSQAGNESGGNFEGPGTKRRRADVAGDVERGAKRGAYMEARPSQLVGAPHGQSSLYQDNRASAAAAPSPYGIDLRYTGPAPIRCHDSGTGGNSDWRSHPPTTRYTG